MTDYRDPNSNMDYRDTRPRLDPDAGMRSSNAMWGWIAGAVFLVLVLAVIFGLGGGTNTATDTSSPPAATTGSGASNPPASSPSTPSPGSPSQR